MNSIIEKEMNIEKLIYRIRGIEVMLDSDIAYLYQVDTKRVNEAYKRNTEKFPNSFTWELDEDDLAILWSQNATANISSKSRSNPRVFTEQGL